MIEKGSPHVKGYPCTRLASQAGPQDLITSYTSILHGLFVRERGRKRRAAPAVVPSLASLGLSTPEAHGRSATDAGALLAGAPPGEHTTRGERPPEARGA